jgi:hypothetical protein
VAKLGQCNAQVVPIKDTKATPVMPYRIMCEPPTEFVPSWATLLLKNGSALGVKVRRT